MTRLISMNSWSIALTISDPSNWSPPMTSGGLSESIREHERSKSGTAQLDMNSWDLPSVMLANTVIFASISILRVSCWSWIWDVSWAKAEKMISTSGKWLFFHFDSVVERLIAWASHGNWKCSSARRILSRQLWKRLTWKSESWDVAAIVRGHELRAPLLECLQFLVCLFGFRDEEDRKSNLDDLLKPTLIDVVLAMKKSTKIIDWRACSSPRQRVLNLSFYLRTGAFS